MAEARGRSGRQTAGGLLCRDLQCPGRPAEGSRAPVAGARGQAEGRAAASCLPPSHGARSPSWAACFGPAPGQERPLPPPPFLSWAHFSGPRDPRGSVCWRGRVPTAGRGTHANIAEFWAAGRSVGRCDEVAASSPTEFAGRGVQGSARASGSGTLLGGPGVALACPACQPLWQQLRPPSPSVPSGGPTLGVRVLGSGGPDLGDCGRLAHCAPFPGSLGQGGLLAAPHLALGAGLGKRISGFVR